MRRLARGHRAPGTRARRVLNQALRELLLAQSGDWPLMLGRRDLEERGRRRAEEHLRRFQELAAAAGGRKADEERLAALEREDAIFPDIDFKSYAP